MKENPISVRETNITIIKKKKKKYLSEQGTTLTIQEGNSKSAQILM